MRNTTEGNEKLSQKDGGLGHEELHDDINGELGRLQDVPVLQQSFLFRHA